MSIKKSVVQFDRAQMLAAFEMVDHVPTSRASEASQYVRLTYDGTTLTLAMTGSATAESWMDRTGGSEEPWVSYVDRRLLGTFLSVSKAEHVELSHRESRLLLKCGWQRLQVAAPSEVPDGYTSWGSGSAKLGTKLPPLMGQFVRHLCTFLPQSPGLEQLEAVYLAEKYGLLATDSLSLAACLAPETRITQVVPPLVAQVDCDGWSVDKNGVGAMTPKGYVYQTISDACRKYPIKKVRSMVEQVRSTKPLVQFHVRQFHEAVSNLTKFSFATAAGMVRLEYTEGPYGWLSLVGEEIDARRQLPVIKGASACTAQWPAERLASALTFLNTMDATGTVALSDVARCYVLRWEGEKHQYVFAVVK